MKLALALVLASTTAATAASRQVNAFHAVDAAAVIDVDITVGPATSVEITGDADEVAKLETKVESGTLVLRLNDQKSHSRLHATITTPSLDGVSLSGVGKITVAKISTANFSASLSGSGDIALSGTARVLQSSISGAGSLLAKPLASQVASVALSGSGNATVQATQTLSAEISGTGNVVVYGNPIVVKKISGTGTVRVKK